MKTAIILGIVAFALLSWTSLPFWAVWGGTIGVFLLVFNILE